MDETVATVEHEVIEQPITEVAPISNSREVNLAAMRKKLEAEEEARKAAERRAQDAEQRMQSIQSSSKTPSDMQPIPEEDDLTVDNEDYVQAKHIKTSNKKIKSKLSATENRLAELEQKLAYFEAKVDTDSLKDFHKVVSEDNIKTLARLYPEDYESIMSNPSLKARSKTAYNMIKNYGIIDTVDTQEVDQRIAANKKKPQLASVASPQSPSSPLAGYDEYGRRRMDDAERDRIMAIVERKKQMG